MKLRQEAKYLRLMKFTQEKIDGTLDFLERGEKFRGREMGKRGIRGVSRQCF